MTLRLLGYGRLEDDLFRLNAILKVDYLLEPLQRAQLEFKTSY